MKVVLYPNHTKNDFVANGSRGDANECKQLEPTEVVVVGK